MRAAQELAVFWNDLRARVPRRSLLIMAGVTAGAAFIGAALSVASTSLDALPVPAVQQSLPVKCDKQVWPHMDNTCLRREHAGHSNRQVRMISLDRDAPTTAPLPQTAQEAPKASQNPPKAPSKSRAKDRPPR